MCIYTCATEATPSIGVHSYVDSGITFASATSLSAEAPNCSSNSARKPGGDLEPKGLGRQWRRRPRSTGWYGRNTCGSSTRDGMGCGDNIWPRASLGEETGVVRRPRGGRAVPSLAAVRGPHDPPYSRDLEVASFTSSATNWARGRTSCFLPPPRFRTATVPTSASRSPMTAI